MPRTLVLPCLLLPCLLLDVGCKRPARGATPLVTVDDATTRLWSDGKAELAGYALTTPRYGESRTGTLVAITVKESQREDTRVKPDAPRDNAFDVLKLNLVEDFQTGVYDYNLMTSVFAGLEPSGGRPAGAISKVSFSSQEWCGHVWHQLRFGATRANEVVHSYFESEGDAMRTLPMKGGALVGDAVWLWARRLAGPQVRRGEDQTVPYLPSLRASRLNHAPLKWTTATLSRAEGGEVTVPAGTFEVEVATVTVAGGTTTRIFVETTAPHRVVQVVGDDGREVALTGAFRTPYWKQHGEADAAVRERLHLPAR